ncbi:MAG: shikimate dehydrogenase [Gammaproteobacteria bacterium]|nr:shikimate dehydrogenase [Gammaproteobacteria bacterium]TVQ48694.1 MAG: shikimate dehydrogenase [Gammaproteobacteria bacterium]
MDRYAVIGHPVAHSRSPWIHAEFARQTGERLSYDRIDVPAEGFAAAVQRFFAEGGCGLNVTVPHKETAFALAAVHGLEAAAAHAVNTLSRGPAGALRGDNTDGRGLVRDLTANLGWPIAGQRVLLVGAGGAARGVLAPLLAQAPAALWLVNRTPARAQALVAQAGRSAAVTAGGFDLLAGAAPFDLIINATSAGLDAAAPALPDSCIDRRSRCYDMLYGPGVTAFQYWAQARGVHTPAAQGLGMLVEQAAESFAIWRGVRPETGPVLARLRAQLGGAPVSG